MPGIELGSVIFHRQQAQLERIEDGERWTLPRAEFLVLTQLLDHPGISLSKERLRCGGEAEPVMSGSAVVKAVFTLRHFVGEQGTQLIQTVPGKGYKLGQSVAEEAEPTPKRQVIPLGRISQPVAVGVIAVMALLAALLWWWPVPPAITPIEPNQDALAIVSGEDKAVSLIRVSAVDLNQDLLESIRHQLADKLRDCPSTGWQRLFLARSNDGQVLNLTFQGEADGRTRLRNIKISDFRSEPTFVSPRWLEEVNLCE
ncbi:helix-turn-helix domain-containing protein [Marinobacter hydrocarbonoclasticus]|nr:helix-turn-helix domain-containing protein [Marinobacter nauticus]